MPDADSYDYLRKHILLPVEALDTSCKTLPEDFSFDPDLTPNPESLSRKENFENSEETRKKTNSRSPGSSQEAMHITQHETDPGPET